MTATDIGLYFAGLFACYMTGLYLGTAVKFIKDMGSSA